ncbi:MAG: 30S ribosomal protein S13 [Candidatus Nealsonbacteria bacterium]|nr:MAG: 30S ribosomal protein S13 [Candidatus Nealsonbacteria bacterium]
MPRIAGVNIPENKQIAIALTYIYGIGRALALQILSKAKINPMKKTRDLSEKEIGELRKIIEEGDYKIEGELRRQILANIKRLREIKCWRGIRHSKGLPVRGQKTRKNSRTVRGNVRRTVGSGKKAPPAPK